MPLIHQEIYCLISILLFIFGKHIDAIFFLTYIPYFYFLSSRIGKKCLLAIILFTICFTLTMHYPIATTEVVLQGEIIDVEEDQIVIQSNESKIVVFGEFGDVYQKDRIEIEVEYQEIDPPSNDSAFNYEQYLQGNGIMQYAYLVRIIDYQEVDSVFRMLRDKFQSELLIDSFATLFLLGIKDSQMDELYEQMSALSIVYLFALSGLHIQYLKKWLHQILQFIISPKYIEYIIFLIIGYYIYVIPYNISFLRAYLVMVLYHFFKKYVSQMDVLCFVTMGMIYFNPYIIYNLSFLFSYFIYFVVLLTRYCKYSSMYIYLASVPIIISIQYMVPAVSFLLGFLLTPIVSILYQGLLWYGLLGDIMKPILLVILTMFYNMFTFFDDFNFFFYFSDPPLFFYLSYYFYLFYAIMRGNVGKKNGMETIKVFCILLTFSFTSRYSMFDQIVMINIGQGDCFLIQNKWNQGNILIDTGGSIYYDVATTTVIPYLRSIGITSLDVVFISHDDTDHSGGLESLQENFVVEEVIREDEDVTYIYGKTEIELLQVPRESSDENDLSLLLYVTMNGNTFLFGGDAPSLIEESLIDYYPDLSVDVLKVGHHGSNTSSSSAFLSWLQPDVALISCGLDNVYGHPTEAVLNRFESLGIPVYRSDLMGTVKIVWYFEDSFIYD